jgi:hypothetical protein
MNVIVWGCGDYGNQLFRNLATAEEIRVVAFADSNQELWGSERYHIPVVAPERITEMDYDVVLVAVSSFQQMDEIKETLKDLGVAESKIIDAVSDKDYMMYFMDARFNWIQNYASWVYENRMHGNVAECGVFRGDSAKFINRFFPDRKLYLCDTFEGFSEDDLRYEKSRENENFNSSRYSSQVYFAETSVERVMQKMAYPDNIVIKKGYFPDCAADIDDEFCFVNLDMDLHVPMLNGIRFFWDKLVDGGCILLHDYFAEEFTGVKHAVELFEEERKIDILKTPIGDSSSLALWKKGE